MTTTITIGYDTNNVAARKLIEGILASGLVQKIKQPQKRKSGIDIAIEDIEAGRVKKATSVDEMFEDILKDS